LERLRRPTATETCDDELNTIEKCRGLVSRAVSVQAAFEALTVLAVQARYRREQRRPTATTKKHESIEAMVERFFNENPGCEGYQHVINQLVTDVTVDEFERGWKSAEECAERAMRVDCPDCEGTGILDACDPYPERKCPTCEPPSEEVLCIVHAFDDQERKDAVRELAARVKATETALATLRQGRERALPWKPGDDRHGELWDAIHAFGKLVYANSPGERTHVPGRIPAVNRIEAALRALVAGDSSSDPRTF
jgi:hypothetical protein